MGDVTATFGVASQIQLLTNFKLNGKLFTTKDWHRGNSLVEFQLGSTQRFGEVEKIFESAKTLGKTCFIVNPFKEIVNKQDPYKDYPDLNCQLVQTKYKVTEVILSERIIGHVAVLLNPASASSGARTAVFDRWSDRHCPTEAPAAGSDRPVQSVPGTGRTGPAGTGRTNLSDQLALALVGQCPSNHRSNTAVRAPLELLCSTG
ncbi:hypothetical protein PCASD_25487 [Puccinia coronata f. sp. avenae]|uniref:Uncharacterized protein n=1 Tax=Puccinia coronata f. sp. avenae TaxID=200324 RepID=A0A2N5TWD0_9BASI|nr:hypothetical protein PCASD_25487 [Puccinia coronata f. sp. avenae]